MKLIALCLALLLTGCETTKLWRGEPADEFIKIVPTSPDEDVEAALQASGREHYCQTLYASTHPNNKICYARLTAKDKLEKIQVKLLKTPEALAIDTGRTILVVGQVTLVVLMHTDTRRGTSGVPRRRVSGLE